MKIFEKPTLEVVVFAVEDIVTTSGDEEIKPVGGDNMGDWA